MRGDDVTTAVLLAFMANPAASQTVIDGSDGGMTAEQKRIVFNAVGEHLRDSVSAQYRKLRPRGVNEVWCGEVNGKSSGGGYVGFTSFIVCMKGKSAIYGSSLGQLTEEGSVLSVGAKCKD